MTFSLQKTKQKFILTYMRLVREKPFIVVLFISIIASLGVWFFYSRWQNILWDEGTTLLWSYRIYSSLRQGDFSLFWKNTLEQIFHPPFISWFNGFLALIFGFSIEKVKVFMLFWLVLGSLIIFKLGQAVAFKHKNLVGYIASFLFLFSPMTYVMSSSVMLETCGTALSLLIVLTYFKARTGRSYFTYILTGLELFLLTMTKYNYGILMAFGLGIEAFVSFIFSKKRFVLLLTHFYLFISYIALFAVWVFLPTNKFGYMFDVLRNRNPFTNGMTDFWGFLLFYPKAVLYMYTSSLVIGFFLVGAFFLALIFFRNFKIRVLWFLVLLNFTLATISTWNVQERYVFTTVPFLYVLGAYVLGALFDFVYAKRRNFLILGIFIGVGILACGKIFMDIVYEPKFIYSLADYTLKNSVYNQNTYKDLWFEYDTSKWTKEGPNREGDNPNKVLDFVFDNIDLNKEIILLGHSNEFSPDYFEIKEILARNQKKGKSLPYKYFTVTIEIYPDSRAYTREYLFMNSWQMGEVRRIENDSSWSLTSSKEFKDLALKVKIYGKN